MKAYSNSNCVWAWKQANGAICINEANGKQTTKPTISTCCMTRDTGAVAKATTTSLPSTRNDFGYKAHTHTHWTRLSTNQIKSEGLKWFQHAGSTHVITWHVIQMSHYKTTTPASWVPSVQALEAHPSWRPKLVHHLLRMPKRSPHDVGTLASNASNVENLKVIWSDTCNTLQHLATPCNTFPLGTIAIQGYTGYIKFLFIHVRLQRWAK